METTRTTQSEQKEQAQQRPPFPKRAVVTAGMPYGNKTLHFGHVGGLFIHADVYARFLRDRLGAENVIFVSGTDCYGSAVEIGYEELVRQGGFEGSLEDFVAMNHERQVEILSAYAIRPDLYAASALGEPGAVHREVSEEIFGALYEGGYLTRMQTTQFYDEASGVFLNGRQVVGSCPIEGCASEYGYADECSLGHQYSPSELIHPISVLSGKAPALRPVENWFFDLARFGDLLKERQPLLEADLTARKYLVSVVEEFLRPPMIYVKKERMEQIRALGSAMPPYAVEADPNKTSDALVFASLEDRAAACRSLDAEHIRYRTGKTLVPFRLSGNVAWGIPVPEKEGAQGLTFWVWPESLWAPISFTKAYLLSKGEGAAAWKDWWASEGARVYQFIGEDNLFFYSVAQTGLFLALQRAEKKSLAPENGELQLTTVIPNRHVLYGGRKASSSGSNKPPSAEALLERYTAEQLRMHFFHLNLAENSASFTPKALSNQGRGSDYDPVLYQGNILTNIFNRIIRSCFYTAQKHFGGMLPPAPVSREAKRQADALILDYEWAMYRMSFGQVISMLDRYLRDVNKHWAAQSRVAEDQNTRAALLSDTFHAVRVATTLLHPIVPDGTERVAQYLNAGDGLWAWENIHKTLDELVENPQAHALHPLAPREDFFAKHPSQLG